MSEITANKKSLNMNAISWALAMAATAWVTKDHISNEVAGQVIFFQIAGWLSVHVAMLGGRKTTVRNEWRCLKRLLPFVSK